MPKYSNNNSRRRGRNSQGQFANVKFSDGNKGKIAIGSISNWNNHHGMTSTGAKVNSLQSSTIGLTTIIKTQGGSVLSAPTNDVEVFAVDLLKGLGYTISSPKV